METYCFHDGKVIFSKQIKLLYTYIYKATKCP